MQVDVGVAGLQRIERPGDQLITPLDRIAPLGMLQANPDAGAAVLRNDRELVRAQSQLPVTPAEKRKAKSDQAAIWSKGAMHQAAVELHGQEQLAWYDIALGRAPDVATHRLAGRVLLLGADQPNLDRRDIQRRGVNRDSTRNWRHAPNASAPSGLSRYATTCRSRRSGGRRCRTPAPRAPERTDPRCSARGSWRSRSRAGTERVRWRRCTGRLPAGCNGSRRCR